MKNRETDTGQQEKNKAEREGVRIRSVTTEDAAELLKIYAPFVEKTAISFEYEVPSVEEFANRIETIGQSYPYLAAEKNGRLLGYAYASAFKTRAAYDWSVETTIYLAEGEKGKGLGRALYTELERQLKQRNILNMNACIAYTDTEDEQLTNASMHFHEHMGFRLVGKFTKCGYKLGKWYDMIWMEKLIGEHLAEPEKVKFK